METYENFDVLAASMAQYVDSLIDEISKKIAKGVEVTATDRELAVHRILGRFTVYQMGQEFEADEPIVLN